MKINKEAKEIWKEYGKCVQYNENIGLYERVEDNENIYNGEQWIGVKGKGLDKPVFNVIKESVNYYLATLISDDIGISIDVQNPASDEGGYLSEILRAELDRVLDRANIKPLNRKAIRNCAVDGDMCMYFYFDPDIETGFKYKGEIVAELIDNTNVMFADPSTEEVEKQPYIIISYRLPLEVVQDMAEENGVPRDKIRVDNEYKYTMNSEHTIDGYVTLLLKLWKEDGTVHFTKSTRDVIIVEDTDTELKLYPIAYMCWEARKNSYHGVSPVTAVKANQRYINKLYAMAMEYTKKMAFPKLLFNRQLLRNGWTNDIGKAIAVDGNPNEALFSNFQGADMSSQVMQIIESTIQQTKEMMGAYDAALGNVNPDNTSAIIATQQAAAAPLDLQRMNYYSFIESYMRVWIDMFRVYYGERAVNIAGLGNIPFDFKLLKDYCLNIRLDIGKGAYWSEVLETQTIDNLIQMGIFENDAELIIEMIPKNNLRCKDKLLALIQQKKAEQEMMMQQQQMMEAQAMASQSVGQQQAAMEQAEQGMLNDNQIQEMAIQLSQMTPQEQQETLANINASDADKQKIVMAMQSSI